jgi:hypothetical protein
MSLLLMWVACLYKFYLRFWIMDQFSLNNYDVYVCIVVKSQQAKFKRILSVKISFIAFAINQSKDFEELLDYNCN